jgi:hypothetical protein
MKIRWKDVKGARGEWRGTLLCRKTGKYSWEVRQDWADPRRLYIPKLDLEFAYGFQNSDGPSIPKLVCMLFGKGRKDLLESGFLHDYGYEHAEVFVRQPDEEWGIVKLDKKSIDVLLRSGVLAQGAEHWQADLIYWGVGTEFGKKAWKKCRKADKDRLQNS